MHLPKPMPSHPDRSSSSDSWKAKIFGSQLCGRFAYATSRSRTATGGRRRAYGGRTDRHRKSAPSRDSGRRLSQEAKSRCGYVAVLQKQKLRLNDRIPAGQVVTLRSVANTDVGGTAVVVTDRVHPDNREMAEAIARCFRLDTVGNRFFDCRYHQILAGGQMCSD